MRTRRSPPNPGKVSTHNYQVPLGALIPSEVEGLLAAGKALGTTHLSNAAYRLHPTEWAIGEAAGTAAARFLVDFAAMYASPTALYKGSIEANRLEDYVRGGGDTAKLYASVDQERFVRAVQNDLVLGGAPIYWADDVGVKYSGNKKYGPGVPDGARPGTLNRNRTWQNVQLAAGAQLILQNNGQAGSLEWKPGDLLSSKTFAAGMARAFAIPPPQLPVGGMTRKQLQTQVKKYGDYTFPGE